MYVAALYQVIVLSLIDTSSFFFNTPNIPDPFMFFHFNFLPDIT